MNAAAWLFYLGLFILMAICFQPAKAQDREAQKESLRLQATEFCAFVGKPPQIIADALNKAVEQDPKTWLPAVLWWNKLHEKYEKARCGDV